LFHQNIIFILKLIIIKNYLFLNSKIISH